MKSEELLGLALDAITMLLDTMLKLGNQETLNRIFYTLAIAALKLGV